MKELWAIITECFPEKYRSSLFGVKVKIKNTSSSLNSGSIDCSASMHDVLNCEKKNDSCKCAFCTLVLRVKLKTLEQPNSTSISHFVKTRSNGLCSITSDTAKICFIFKPRMRIVD